MLSLWTESVSFTVHLLKLSAFGTRNVIVCHKCEEFRLAPLSQWYGHPRVLGILIVKTPCDMASSVTLTQIAKVLWEGDAHITRGLGMGMPISL